MDVSYVLTFFIFQAVLTAPNNVNHSCKFCSYPVDCISCRLLVHIRQFILECVHSLKLEDLLLCLLWILTLRCRREGGWVVISRETNCLVSWFVVRAVMFGFCVGAGDFSLLERLQITSGALPASNSLSIADTVSVGKASGVWISPLTASSVEVGNK